ncbi:MAG: ABC transporter substrate-binding protein [Alphaproteobacteria bacterium]|nr:ABC transporter substrate-binding protein [Alphaproteobacteria bacterium]
MTKYALSRRFMLAAAAGSLAATRLSAPALAQGLRRVRFQLAWLPTGGNLFTIVAREKGFWSARGLDVPIQRGFGSGAAIQAVANNQNDITLAATGTAILSVIKGLNLHMPATCGYDSTMGIAVPADSGINQPRDLEGKTLGTVANSGEAPYVPAFFALTRIDASRVTRVSLDANVLEQSLIARRVNAISTFAISSVPAFLANNFPARMMLFADLGLPFYQLSVVTRNDFMASNRALVQDFVQGLLEGVRYSLLNPAESVDLFLRHVPEVAATDSGRRTAQLGNSIFQVTMLAEEAMANKIGYSDLGKVQTMARNIEQYVAEAGERAPPIERWYSNDMVGNFTLTQAEWASVRSNNAEVGRMMGRA